MLSRRALPISPRCHERVVAEFGRRRRRALRLFCFSVALGATALAAGTGAWPAPLLGIRGPFWIVTGLVVLAGAVVPLRVVARCPACEARVPVGFLQPARWYRCSSCGAELHGCAPSATALTAPRA